ncbi:protoheme IX farnesyltransferase, mitochondrial [Magnolia sinica]|uniref:protoheme IX farnesyltransferase, mitochondrial n=1 Tax=Magnolia sinica TaxID=86752 RepID=UPI00265B38CB|nr:protoheme IX farnesyltransferase, mitochondrial [Magnolia sinica]
MWRNSSSFSSKLFSLSRANPNPNSPIFRGADGVRTPLFPPPSHLHSSSSGIPPSVDPLKPALAKSEAGRSFGFASSSSAAILSSPASASVAEAVRHYGQCYWELSKARLSLLVVATSGAGFVLGSGSIIDFSGLCWTCAGTMMVAASANSLNQVFEINNDAKMKRTRQRPLPSGRLGVAHAAIWASSVGVAGTTLLAWKANALAAGLAASNLALYAFVYTPLKQIHPVNTWVGAVVGAIPPLLGWAAASGEISLNGMILPAALYFWQIPHFMALAYFCRNDYATGGFKMISLADPSGQRTALVALRNCLYLLPLGFLAFDWGVTSEWFCIESSLFTLLLSAAAMSFHRDRTTKNARRMFHASLLYLPVFMASMLLHRHPNNHPELTVADSDGLLELPFSAVEGQESEKKRSQNKLKKNPVGAQARPPVAYASIPPFPFLPAPLYISPDQ